MALIRNSHNRQFAGKAKDVEDLDKKVVSALGTGTNGQVLYKTATGVEFGDLPTPTDVEANPAGEATTDLSKLKVGNTIYGVGGGSGGGTQLYLHTISWFENVLYVISTSNAQTTYSVPDLDDIWTFAGEIIGANAYDGGHGGWHSGVSLESPTGGVGTTKNTVHTIKAGSSTISISETFTETITPL